MSFGSILVPLLLLTGTAFVFFFAKGYRFNFRDGEIEKTGVVSIKTTPRRASVFIDGTSVGTTPRALSSIKEGEHMLRVRKTGYHEWSKRVTVEAEQLVPFEITLFLKETTAKTIFPDPKDFDHTKDILAFATSENGTKVFFAVLNTPAPNLNEEGPPPDVSTTVQTIQIWSYQLKRRFWETDAIPLLIGEFTAGTLGRDISDPSTYSILLLPSPNGSQTLFSIHRGPEITAQVVLESRDYYLFNAETLQTDSSIIISLDSRETILWSKNSQHIMFTRINEVRSINTTTRIQTVISEMPASEPPQIFLWTTNDAGTVFIIKNLDTSTVLQSTSPDGGNVKTLLEFPQNEDETADEITPTVSANKSDSDPNLSTLKLSEILQSANKIVIAPDNTKLILFSNDTIAFFSLIDDSFETYPASSPCFVAFSPEETSLLYEDLDHSYYELWFSPEERDPLHKKGSRILLLGSIGSTVLSIAWHPSSNVILYTTSSSDSAAELYALDTESLQSNAIAKLPHGLNYVPDGTGKQIFAECEENILCLLKTQE